MRALRLFFLYFSLACTGNEHPDCSSASLFYQPLNPLYLTELKSRLIYPLLKLFLLCILVALIA